MYCNQQQFTVSLDMRLLPTPPHPYFETNQDEIFFGNTWIV